MANKYNSEGYYSPTEFEAFTRIEKEEKAAAKAAAFRPIVYICSPYSGDTEKNSPSTVTHTPCWHLPMQKVPESSTRSPMPASLIRS